MFLKFMKFTGEKEDFFTECLAAALRADQELARSFLTTITGPSVDGVCLGDHTITLETQICFPGSSVDMVFSVSDKLTIGVENKLWSAEGKGQLEKYLRLPLNRIAFITGYDAPIADKVFYHRNYIRPSTGRRHFVWSDFYDCVAAGVVGPGRCILNQPLLNLFAHFGFQPPKPELGDLLDPTPGRARQNRQNFAKLWKVAKNGFRARGWDTGPGSIAELYVDGGKSTRINGLWIDPIWSQGNLRIRVYPKRGVAPADLIELLERSEFPCHDKVQAYPTVIRRKRKETVVDVRVSLRMLLENASETGEMESRLAAYVLTVFDILV